MASLSALPFDYQVQAIHGSELLCPALSTPPLQSRTREPVPYGQSQAAKARVTRAAEAAMPVQVKRFLATPSFDALTLAFAQHAAARFEAAALAEVGCSSIPQAVLHYGSTPAMRCWRPSKAVPDQHIA